MAVIETDEGQRLFTSRRAAGQPLHDLLVEQILTGTPVKHDPSLLRSMHRVAQFLAMIHAQEMSPVDQPSQRPRALQHMARRLSTELKQLGVSHPDRVADEWLALLPGDLPLLTKRDAHTENWLITDLGDVVALDLQSAVPLPAGFELAQFVEDVPAFPAHDDQSRTALADVYLGELRRRRPELSDRLPEAGSREWRNTYACFAARRAVYLLLAQRRRSRMTSSESLRIGDARRDHARAVLHHSRSIVPALELFESVLATEEGRGFRR